jgi:hypothetical protein
MSFWNDASTLSPKQAHRWVIYLGDDRTTALYFKSVDKPSFAIKNIKTKYLYSHEFNFPGRVSWQPITLVLNDLVIYNKKEDFIVDWHLGSGGPIGTTKKINESTQFFIYGLLNKAGYYGPNEATQTTYESNVYLRGFNFKKDLIRELVRSSSYLEIQELDNRQIESFEDISPAKNVGKVFERWKLFNPLISDVKFEKLDYSVDNALSITLTLNYDWAELHGPEGATAAAPSAPTVAPPPAPKTADKVELPKVEAAPVGIAPAPAVSAPVVETAVVGQTDTTTQPAESAPVVGVDSVGTPSTAETASATQSPATAAQVTETPPVGETANAVYSRNNRTQGLEQNVISDFAGNENYTREDLVALNEQYKKALDSGKPIDLKIFTTMAATAENVGTDISTDDIRWQEDIDAGYTYKTPKGQEVGPPEPDIYILSTGEKVLQGVMEAKIENISERLEQYNFKVQNPSGMDTDILKAIKEQIPQLEQRLSDLKNATPGMLPPIGEEPAKVDAPQSVASQTAGRIKGDRSDLNLSLSQQTTTNNLENLGVVPLPADELLGAPAVRLRRSQTAAEPSFDPTAASRDAVMNQGNAVPQGVVVKPQFYKSQTPEVELVDSGQYSNLTYGPSFGGDTTPAKPVETQTAPVVAAVEPTTPPRKFTFNINDKNIQYNLNGNAGTIPVSQRLPDYLLQPEYSSQINAAFQERLQQLAKKENTNAIGNFQDIFLLQASYNIAATPGYAGKFVNNIDSTADWYALYNKYRK